MSLGPQYRRVLGLIAGLSTVAGLTPDLRTLAARCDLDAAALRALLRTLIANGLVQQLAADPETGRPENEYRLSITGWDAVDDLAAVDPRSDLDAKQREYSRAAAEVSRFTGPPASGDGRSPSVGARTFAEAVAAEELAKHRYDRAVARYRERTRRPVGSFSS